jgi:hypothetical protein
VTRRGVLAALVGWLAFWLGGIAHADCAVRFVPAGSSGTVVQTSAIDHAPAPLYPKLAGDDPDCQQLLEASAVPQAAVAPPVADQKSVNFTLPPAAPPLLVRPVDRLTRAELLHLIPSSRSLYLRTSRLLI